VRSGPDVRDQILLVDGMSVLVRAAKAAEKMPRLSWNGVPTAALTVFMNTMTKRLSGTFSGYPTHVVVCWEGEREQNWRYKYFPEYRQSRNPDRGGASPEVEQARLFCQAAGLYQSQSLRFEGDDIVAAWWRLARELRPDTPVVILSSDADLLQLADEQTVILAAENDDLYTDWIVKDLYGCLPEKLALLRALAGDTSDEIPGARGIGLSRAAGLVQQSGGEPADVFRIIGELSNPAEAERIQNFYTIMNLRTPDIRPLPSDLAGYSATDVRPGPPDAEEVLALASWRPWGKYQEMREFLEGYGMKRMLRRLDDGTLPWSTPESQFPGTRA
jgi:DNA polymerase I